MTIGRQGLWACFLLAVQSQTNDSLSLSPSERTLPVAGQRLQKNMEPGGQRCSLRAGCCGKPPCFRSAGLPPQLLFMGPKFNCKGSASSQGTGKEGHFGTGPQPDLAGVHPVSLAPMGAQISFPHPLLFPEAFLLGAWCLPPCLDGAAVSELEGGRAECRAGCSPIHSLTHSFNRHYPCPSSGSVLNYMSSFEKGLST